MFKACSYLLWMTCIWEIEDIGILATGHDYLHYYYDSQEVCGSSSTCQKLQPV